MKLYKHLDLLDTMPKHTVVALGNFDGLHRGHCALIERAAASAKEQGLCSVVFAFSDNPKKAFGARTKKIISAAKKAEIIESLGIDFLIDIPFDEHIRKMDAEAFATEIIANKLRARAAFCGFNYRFGHKAAGTPDFLAEIGKKAGFSVTVIPPYIVDGELVSSSKIRELIRDGDMEKSARFLGRRFCMEGIVTEGNKLGKTIGFATANVNIDEEMVSPPNGVYITTSFLDGRRLPSVTNVGNKPTIGEYGRNVETHIFDFEEDLYGSHLRVAFIKKLRGEKKFASVFELQASIANDCRRALDFHGIT